MSKNTVNNKLDQALKLHQEGKTAAAEKIYLEIIATEPSNADVYHLLGILYSQQNNFITAQRYLQKALKLDPDSPSYHNSMGNILRNLGQLDKAIFHYQHAIKLQPNYAVAHNSLGNIYLKKDELEKAQQYYQQALNLQPNYPDAHYNLAIIFLKKDLPDIAKFHLKETLKLEPEHVEANNQLAQLLHQEGNIDDAIEYYKICTKYGPFNAEAFHNLGSIFLEKRKPEIALKYFLRLLQIAPNFDTYYNLGLIYMVLDRLNDAVQYFNRALELKPDDLATHENLGVMFLRVEDYEQAIHHYQQALRTSPDNEEVKYILNALTQKKQPKSAPKEYIEHLFDQYAGHYEQHLTKMLDYKAPELLHNAVIAETSGNSLTIIDLGCGTGLSGEKLKPLAKKLIGIDLSANMIEIAKQKNIYDELIVADINDALKKYHDIDLIIAADTVVYLGDLTELFINASNTLINKGLFSFTCETTYDYPYKLQKSARYAHHKKYIEELAATNKLNVILCNNVILRKQQGKQVEGYLFVLRKTS